MFKYYVKKMLGDKGMLFWIMLFPICLMLCFKIAFSNLYDEETHFDPVKAVLVDGGEVDIQDSMLSVIDEMGLTDVMTEVGFIDLLQAIENEDEAFIENYSFDEELFRQRVDEENILFDPNEMNLNTLEIFGDGIYVYAATSAIEKMGEEGEDQCFDLSKASTLEEATALLDSGEKHVAFYFEDNTLKAILSSDYSSVDLIIVQSFMSAFEAMYSQTKEDMMGDLLTADEATLSESDLAEMLGVDVNADDQKLDSSFFDGFFNGTSQDSIQSETYLTAKASVFEEEPNPYNWYYYATFVMGVMFNIILGIQLVGDTQADVTKSALRVGLSSTSKSKIFMASFAAKLLVVFICECIQLVLMNYIFKVPVGNRIGHLMLFLILADLFTLSLGEVFGLYLKGEISKRENIANALLMTSVFLSGEMIASLPGTFEVSCPIINDINPATVLNFAFYNLVYYEDLSGFYQELLKIALAAVVLIVISIVRLRRQKYASL